MVGFLRRSDELVENIKTIVEHILTVTPSKDLLYFSMTDVDDIIHALPPVKKIWQTEFFQRATLSFCLLRSCLELMSVPLTDRDQQDQ